jgi:peptidoglycan/LPS O-acetylase OafA/YrhL
LEADRGTVVNAAFFSPRPRRGSSAADPKVALLNYPRARRAHRLVATAFTLTVAANFVAMVWGQPPAWITYAPLPPLLFLLTTGLVMLVAPWMTRRTAR